MNRKLTFNLIALVLVGTIMKFVGPSGSLDAQLFYTGEEARSFLRSLGEGKSFSYFINEILDLLFITLYSTLAFLSVKKIFRTVAFAPWLALIPGVFDLIETSTIMFILKVGDTIEILDHLGVITFLKWSSGFLLIFLIILKIAMNRWYASIKA